MKTPGNDQKIYRVKILDFSYKDEFDILAFKYLTFEVSAKDEKEAIKRARKNYMAGLKAVYEEEIPLQLKIFSICS